MAAALSGTAAAQALGHASDPVAVGAGRLKWWRRPGHITLLLGRRAALLACFLPPSDRPDRHRSGGPRDLPERVLLRRGQHRRGDRNRGSAGHRPGGHRLICGSGFRRAADPVVVAATGLAVFGCVVLVTADSQGTAQVAGRCRARRGGGTCYGAYTTAAGAAESGRPATAAMAVTLSLGAVLLASCGCSSASRNSSAYGR